MDKETKGILMNLIPIAAQAAHPYFVENNWTYWDSLTPPSVGRIATTIEYLIEEAFAENDRIETGRFAVEEDTIYFYGDNDSELGEPPILCWTAGEKKTLPVLNTEKWLI